MYTGALENYPEVVAQISASRELLGNPPEVLEHVRNPLEVAQVLRDHGLCTPNVFLSRNDVHHDVPCDGSWLRKRIRSAGGTNIERWLGETSETSAKGDVYFQQLIAGEPCSAVFVAAKGRAVMLGATRQLIGREFATPGEFQYAGSLGPCVLSPPMQREWKKIGEVLSEAFSLQGLFGVDAVVSSDHSTAEPHLFPIEVNPRYTASVEIFERAYDFSAVRWHVEACREETLPDPNFMSSTRSSGSGYLTDETHKFAKQILYARRDGVVTPAFIDWTQEQNNRHSWPLVADLPPVGSELRSGSPVVTIFASGATGNDSLSSLSRRHAEAYSALEK